MSSSRIDEKMLLEEIRSLEDDKKRELLDFILFLKGKKSSKKKIAQNLNLVNVYTSQDIFMGKRMTINFDINRINKVICKIVK